MNNSSKYVAIGAVMAVFVMLTSSTLAEAAIYVMIPGVKGDVTTSGPGGTNDWFIADSFSFGVQRPPIVTEETKDINIGVGEIQDVTISKEIDSASAFLAQFSINGNSIGDIDICVTEGTDLGGNPQCYLHYKLERVFVRTWSTSGDANDRPTEEVSFYYNKIAFAYASDNNSGNLFEPDGTMSWDNIMKTPWIGSSRFAGDGLAFTWCWSPRKDDNSGKLRLKQRRP